MKSGKGKFWPIPVLASYGNNQLEECQERQVAARFRAFSGLIPPPWHYPHSVPPESVEPVRGQFGVTHRMLYVLVAHVVLDGPCIVALIGQVKSTGMSEHMGMNWEAQFCLLASPGDHLPNRRSSQGSLALGDKDVGGIFSV